MDKILFASTTGTDYDTMLKMMLKLKVPTVTFHNSNGVKIIRSFGVQNTMEYVFDNDKLVDIIVRDMSFVEWVASEFLLHKPDGFIITIYR